MFVKHGRRHYQNIDEPDVCPRCHTAVMVQELIHKVVEYNEAAGPIVQAVYQCPKRNCSQLFIATFTAEPQPPLGHTENLVLLGVSPKAFKQIETEQEVSRLSPNYVEILQQSAEAEDIGLTEVSGMGYRKALEFLIKDYAKYINSEAAEEIERQALMAVINNYIAPENKRIKQCAERAAWLGNDETHYVRRHTEHDLQDLKRLVRLTATWIASDLQAIEYEEQLQKK